MAVNLKRPDELIIMRQAGRIVARVHAALREAVRPGITGLQLDKIAREVIAKHDAIPTFVGHHPQGVATAFPSAITVGVNHELVHGIPSDKPLEEGTIVSLDVAATYKGYVGDAAFTMGVGKITPELQHLINVGEEALAAGIKSARAGNQISDIAMSIQAVIEANHMTMPREYGGHGVGQQMWEPPSVPNWWPQGRRTRRWRNYDLQPGMTIAIEPMVLTGKQEVKTTSDHWTVVTVDGKPCTHVEHTIAITEDEPLILTLP
ncbi:MAG: type I methionyl aminopeptidase [Anaerolineae bacterium]|nr:type I methionyl aminopeptidase [Anaerolineae bacterium]